MNVLSSKCGQPETVSVAFPGRAREKIEAHVGHRITALRSSRPTHLIDAEEVYGTLRSIMSLDDETVIAQIGPRAVLLPASLKLLAVGLRICVLRLDDEYYVRGLPA